LPRAPRQSLGQEVVEDALARLQAHAGRLLRLQRQLGELLPDYMADACRVANIKGEELVIHVESAGLAVKLRQAVPSLLADFARAGVILRDIKIKVAVREYRPRHRRLPTGT
jgi:hypothetical protein